MHFCSATGYDVHCSTTVYQFRKALSHTVVVHDHSKDDAPQGRLPKGTTKHGNINKFK